MLGFQTSLVIALSFGWVLVATNLNEHLNSAKISAVFPGDVGYISASASYNQRFTFKPAAITYPKSPEDVSTIVSIGASTGFKVATRSGGHSYIANGLGGQNGALVIDLSNFKTVTVNSSKGTAIIGSGNRIGDIALALNDAGRALPLGACPYIGIGGHSSYGGFGYTSRMWGLTLDNVISVNMVLANGTIITASSDHNSDIFWAMRGAGGSFGIATSIEVTTHPAPPSATVFQYTWDLSVKDATDAVAAFQSFVETGVPPEFGAYLNLFHGSTSGKIGVVLNGGWYGPPKGFNATIAPFLSKISTTPRTTLNVGSYINSVTAFGQGTGVPSLNTSAPAKRDTFYAKSLMTPENSPMSTSAIMALMNYLAHEGFSSSMPWLCQIELYGGKNSAINAVDPDATAFAHRRSRFSIHFHAPSRNRAPPYPQEGFNFVNGMVDSIVSNSPADWDYGAYPNYVDDKLVDWQRRYYGTHYPRLKSIKDKYDPKDIFNFPTAIQD